MFNTVITRAQSLVVSVGNPFLLLKMEDHMVVNYGENGRCWSNYLHNCLENKTLYIHGKSEDEAADTILRIKDAVKQRIRQPSVPLQGLKPSHQQQTVDSQEHSVHQDSQPQGQPVQDQHYSQHSILRYPENDPCGPVALEAQRQLSEPLPGHHDIEPQPVNVLQQRSSSDPLQPVHVDQYKADYKPAGNVQVDNTINKKFNHWVNPNKK